MPVKYHCPKCDRRFVDWGAEKLGFKCPDCVDEVLLRLGHREDQPVAAPRLSRRPKRPDKAVEEEELEVIETEDEFEDDETIVADDEIELAIGADEERVPVAPDDDQVSGDEIEVEGEVDDDIAEIDDDGEIPADLDFDEDGSAAIEEFDV